MVKSLLSALIIGVAAVTPLAAQSALPLGGEVKPKSALRIVISGQAKLSLVSLNDKMFDAALGDAIAGAPGSPLVVDPSGSGGTGGSVFFDPMITLNLDFKLAENLEALIQLETQFNKTTGRIGASALSDRDLEVEQAYVRWNRAFDERLSLTFGIQDFAKDFTENGNPFLVDVAHSENPFGNPNAAADTGAPQASSSGAPGLQEAVGVLGRYNLGDANLDFWYFNIQESYRKNSDDVLWGVSFEQALELAGGPANVGLIMMGLQNDSSSTMFTVGGGGYMYVMNKTLKLYAEAYVQFGTYANTAGRSIEQEDAFAGYFGFRYNLPGLEQSRAFVDMSYWEISGDDEGDDGRNENFVSLENNNDTLIMEDGYYGLDVDTNYRAIKARGGFRVVENVRVEALVAFFELQDNNGNADNATSEHDRLGTELDIILNYIPGDNLTFRLRTGWLFDAKALGLREDMNVTVLEAELKF